jgi:hypothetical protein
MTLLEICLKYHVRCMLFYRLLETRGDDEEEELHCNRAWTLPGAFFAICSNTSRTVRKSSSDGFPNLFMSKWFREREYFSVESDRSRQPELSLTTNLCIKLATSSVRRLRLEQVYIHLWRWRLWICRSASGHNQRRSRTRSYVCLGLSGL